VKDELFVRTNKVRANFYHNTLYLKEMDKANQH